MVEGDGLQTISVIIPPREVVLIPVNHDYGELWRWSVILDRFANSAGNTIGITGAGVSQNFRANPTFGDLFTAAGPGPATLDEWGYVVGSTVRDGIVIVALVPQLVVDALDELLPLLGIPQDAVYLVGQTSDAAEEFVPQ